MDGSGASSGEGCLVRLRDLLRSPLPRRRVLSDKRKSALGSEISRFSSDLDGLASGFASEPAIEVIR
jgi:hypothetical protein